ncbi:hypothetical protein G9272_31970 [Streptomyces asoensis]|uniref:Transposase n=1 Tax=Streptomyces asoensis TaxID=249586 RepID=A0A6M4WUY7_9ACTN|nr:hypothetical protein [Streptomyces asoensis]QJT04337.1 hypothetical protein G9272_31970 [Streptomyces asoensis]
MPPTPSERGSVRSAAAVNEAIRAIAWRARGREWKQAEKALYRLLVEEWVAAEQRAKMVTAA